MIRGALISLAAAAILCQAPCASADGPWSVTAGATSTFQAATDTRAKGEALASFDLVVTRALGGGEVRAYLEANTTPRREGISTLLAEANSDAGSALNKYHKGRIQLSELAYLHRFGKAHDITLGLIDVTAYFDQSRIASDENTQFLGSPFVQNPTIGFPDYTLGIVYEFLPQRGPAFRSAVTSSHGLADNPNLSYRELFDIHENERGLFGIASLAWRQPRWHVRAGIWTNTSRHDLLDGTGGGRANFGTYGLGGISTTIGHWGVRLGWANPAVSRAAAYAGLTYQVERQPLLAGVGGGVTRVSGRDLAPESASTGHFEAYVRWSLPPHVIVTADLQHLRNPNLDADESVIDGRVTVFGLRLTLLSS